MKNNQTTLLRQVSIPDLIEQAGHAADMLSRVRGQMLAPEMRKAAPKFSTAQLAALCGADKGQIAYRLKQEDLPSGELNGARRFFTLAETRQWIKAYHAPQLRPSGARAVTIAVGNFKGGVTKTTTAMCLAQGLSLRGHRVLMIDTDPQGSLTTLFGVLPDAEVSEEQTVAALMSEKGATITSAIQQTYWDGIDLVAAASHLFSAEFALPARQMREPGFKFWDVLNIGLEDVRDDYDVIIIDTAPALSYLTINSFMAADALVIPLPPNALDFASSVQFWSLFSDLASNLMQNGLEKKFEFINVLLARVDTSDVASSVVREWIAATYAEKVLPIEIPKTSVTVNAAAEFGTVYDISKYDGSLKTYRRAREAYDRVADLMEQSIMTSWRRQLSSN